MDELRQLRELRDDLRALKKQYPELTRPAAKRRLEDYLSTQEDTMPAKGDRTLGEDLTTLTFKVQASVMPTVEKHLRMLQRTTRYQRIGRSDALRDIFLRGIDSIENPKDPFPVALTPDQLPLSTPPPVEPAATSAGGAIPPAPAYEARVLTPEASPEVPLEHPLALEAEDTPLELALDARQDDGPSVEDLLRERGLSLDDLEVYDKSAPPAETVKPSRSRKAARPKAAPPVESKKTRIVK